MHSSSVFSLFKLLVDDEGREVRWLADLLRVELGLVGEQVQEESRGEVVVVDHDGLHELVVPLGEVVGLAHGETSALGHNHSCPRSAHVGSV